MNIQSNNNKLPNQSIIDTNISIFLETFTPLTIAKVWAGSTISTSTTAAELGVWFAFGFVYAVDLIGFWATSARSFFTVLLSPPLFRAVPVRWRLFEVHAPLTIAVFGGLPTIVSVRTAVRVIVVRVTSGVRAVDFRYFPSTPTEQIKTKRTVYHHIKQILSKSNTFRPLCTQSPSTQTFLRIQVVPRHRHSGSDRSVQNERWILPVVLARGTVAILIAGTAVTRRSTATVARVVRIAYRIVTFVQRSRPTTQSSHVVSVLRSPPEKQDRIVAHLQSRSSSARSLPAFFINRRTLVVHVFRIGFVAQRCLVDGVQKGKIIVI